MLVLTPRPHPTECISGYLHSLSTANGYSRPSWIIEPYRNGYHNDDYRRVTPEVICKISGLTGPDAERVCVRPDREGDRTTIRLVGTELHVSHVDMQNFRICPHCVAKNGRHEAFWHLRRVRWCPIHRTPLLRKCGACGVELRWNRPGIGRCNCGAELTKQVKDGRCSKSVADLLLVIRHALYQHESSAGVRPKTLEHLFHLDLYRLLRLIGTLENVIEQLAAGDGPAFVKPVSHTFEETARILGNWPRSFQVFLKKNYHEWLEADGSRRSFKRTFPWAFWTLGRNLKEEAHQLDFLREEVIRFGAGYWTREQLCRNSPRARLMRLKCKWGSIPESAALIGMDQRTLLGRVRDGLVPAKKCGEARRNRNYKIELSWARKQQSGEELSASKAAAALGISQPFFMALAIQGVYEARTLTWHRNRFSRDDVTRLKKRMDALIGKYSTDATLAGIMFRQKRLDSIRWSEKRAKVIHHLLSLEPVMDHHDESLP